MSTIQAVYNPAGFSGSSSIASGSSDHGIRNAVEAPIPIKQIMIIKKTNKIRLLIFIGRPFSNIEPNDKDGKNNAAVHEITHKIAPYFKAEIQLNLFDTLAHICSPNKALIWKGIGIHLAIAPGTLSTSSTYINATVCINCNAHQSKI